MQNLVKRNWFKGILIVVFLFGVYYVSLIEKRQEVYLPQWEEGMKWTYRVDEGDTIYTLSMEVVGMETIEDKAVYRMKVNVEPAYLGIAKDVEMWVYEDSLALARIQVAGEIEDGSFMLTETSLYYWDDPLFPLSIGKKVMYVKESRKRIVIDGKENESTEKTENKAVEIETKERITVPAGTFTVFKLVSRDNEGNITSTSWHSDKVKFRIKANPIEGITWELMSYTTRKRD